MSTKERAIIESHVNSHNGGWYRIIDRYTDGVRILWGRDDQQWEKFLKTA